MEITVTKGRGQDRIAARRADGSSVETSFPHKGPVPHDAVHFFVERGLCISGGFWGLVAGGWHPEDIAGLARANGHASASRAGLPGDAIVELLQAERLVECFEADLWSGTGDDAALLEVARTGCAASHVPCPAALAQALPAIRDELAEFACTWLDVDEGQVARLVWSLPVRAQTRPQV
jgi:hypothetical protein